MANRLIEKLKQKHQAHSSVFKAISLISVLVSAVFIAWLVFNVAMYGRFINAVFHGLMRWAIVVSGAILVPFLIFVFFDTLKESDEEENDDAEEAPTET